MKKMKKRSTIRVLIMSALAGLVVFNSTVTYAANAAENQKEISLPDTLSESLVIDNSQGVVTIEGGRTEEITCRFKRVAEYLGSYRSELTTQEKMIYDAMRKRNNEEFCIDFSGLGYKRDDVSTTISDMIYSAFFAYTRDYPDMYWIGGYSLSVLYDKNDNINMLYLKFVESYPNAFSERSKVESGISSAFGTISSTRQTGSRYHTLKAIHDYICNNASYDYDVLEGGAYAGQYAEDQVAAPLFGGGRRGKKFVCAGYASSFKLLCNMFGIPCVRIKGDAGGAHAWNLVKMEDGKWYAVDVTWDDGNTIDYNYFLVGSDTFNSKHTPITDIDLYNPLAYPTMASTRYVYTGAPDFGFVSWGDGVPIISGSLLVQMNKNNWSACDNCEVKIAVDGVVKTTLTKKSGDLYSFVFNLNTFNVEPGEQKFTATFSTTTGVKITEERRFVARVASESLQLTNTSNNPVNSCILITGHTYYLLAKLTPKRTCTDHVIWLSSDTSVAKVSQSGAITGVNVGVATITAKCGSYSAKFTVTVIPRAPYSVKGTAVDYTTVRLNWATDSRVQFVEVWCTGKAGASQKDYVQLGIYNAKDGTSMSRNLTSGSTYYYKFRGYSYDSSKSHKYYSDYSPVISAKSKTLQAPFQLKTTPQSSTTVKLQWNTSSDTQFVEVWRAGKANASQSDYVQLGVYNASDKTSMSRKLTTGKTYYYKFRGYRYDSNKKKIYSGYSAVISATP